MCVNGRYAAHASPLIFHLQYSEQLLQYILLPQQLLPVSVTGRHNFQRVFPVLFVLFVGQKVDDVLQQAG